MMKAILLTGLSVIAITAVAVKAQPASTDASKLNLLSYTHLIKLDQGQTFETIPMADEISRLPASAYKIASVHFIGHAQSLEFTGVKKLAFTDESAEICKKLGYGLTSCSNGLLSDSCPYNPAYYKNCCAYDYKYTEDNCKYPNTLSSDSCGGKYRCVCDPNLYPYTSCLSPQIPASGSGSSCNAYGKTYYSDCLCPSIYSNTCSEKNMLGKGVGCTKNGITKYTSCECKSGYNLTCSGKGTAPARATDYCLKNGIKYYNSCCLTDETGCEYGTYLCANGCGGTRKCCKSCDPEDRTCQCPGYVFCGDSKTGSGASCSAGGKTFYETCLVKETCIRTNVYCGYIAPAGGWEANAFTYARPHCITQQGEQYNLYVQCQCTLEGIKGPCAGKRICSGNLGHQNNGSPQACICNGQKWFDKCDDNCNLDSLSANGGNCWAHQGNEVVSMYYVKNKCTTLTGGKVNYWGNCNGIDCTGNKGPCYGKRICDPQTIAVNPCSCGGVTYGSSCVIKCPYEQTEADCKSGQSFKPRCRDNDNIWYGECT